MLKEICVIIVVSFIGTFVSKLFVIKNRRKSLKTTNGGKVMRWQITNIERGSSAIWVTIKSEDGVTHEDFVSQFELDKINELVGSSKTFQSECDDPIDAFADMIRQAVG
jgi:hypothetical protein